MLKSIWNIFYLARKTPWDTGITPPELVELVEGGEVPKGHALDIGCGTGTNAIYLSQHGFQAEGVDIAWLAIRRARDKARRMGADVKFFTGDILRLGLRGGPPATVPVGLALDIGCLHSLDVVRRQSYVRMLRRVLCTGGLYLLYAWGPRQWRGRPAGVRPEDIRSMLRPDFDAMWTRQGEEWGAPSYWYLFKRLL